MPEKPKRRNKNKNKRKNKNNRSDNLTNNNDVKENETEKCTDQSDLNSELKENDEVTNVNQNIGEQSVTEIPNALGISCEIPNEQINNQDLNNNSNVNTTQALTVLVQTLGVPALINDIQAPLIVDVTDGCIESQDSETYIVESPEQSLKTKSNKSKLTISIKSKSLDNEDEPKIVEITEDLNNRCDEDVLDVIDTSNVLVSDIESDFEWEKADELHGTEVTPLNEAATGTVSITAVPLNVAHCHQTKPLTPEMEISLRNYLKTLDLSTNPENIESVEIKAEIEQIINREIKHRLRKKAQADDFNLQRLGPPRMLDVIDEEGSSESSMTSRRQSYLSDKKSDIDDLDDDVFEDSNKATAISQKVASFFPKTAFGRLIPQQCVLVGTKIKDPEITEARGDWTMSTVEKMTGAEVVYLTDTSSSSSSLHDLEDENDDGVETDVSVRMITPTIEVTDTENLLKNTFIPEAEVKSCDSILDTEKNNISQTKNDKNLHEIVVLSTDDIKTNLYVKEIQTQNSDVINDISIIKPISKDKNSSDTNQTNSGNYDLEMKVLKCELNDAINNLIKEVSDSELNENSSSVFSRQDSSSSVCSSQCTAKYNPTHSSLNDIVSNVHDEISENNKPIESTETSTAASHVKEVIDHVTGTTAQNKKTAHHNNQPLFLRDICVKRIAKFPYGDKILEELASVSERLQNIASRRLVSTENSTISEDFKNELCHTNMPYFPLPDLSTIEKVILPTKAKDSVPPPVQPRHSSLKREKSREEDAWTGVPTKNEPVYVCLSPSQKMLMEKTHTVLTKDDASELINTHKNYIDRRGYNECFSKQNQKDESNRTITPILPFKSQTGSRLLALIRDPKLTNSINSINKHCSTENFDKKFSTSQNLTIQNNHRIGGNSDTFKPIPPPRPKKMSSFYESDESSDFTDSSLRSMKSERKFFHYSTGNLSKEIEDDVSSIQKMHRNYANTREKLSDYGDSHGPRRPSLPKDLCDQQMEYIRQKEKEVEAEIRRLEAAQNNKVSSSTETKSFKAPFVSEKEFVTEKYKDANNFFISKQRDFFSSSQNFGKIDKPEKGRLHSVFSRSQEELLREKMYSEYVTQMAEREERKQHKVIKITNTPVVPSTTNSKSMPALDVLDSKVNNRIEKEFICKARERWDKLGIKDPETEDERDSSRSDVYREPKVIEHKIKVIEGKEEKEIRNLPRHLQEFVRFTAKDKEKADSSETVMITPTFKARSTSPAVWRPGAPTPPPAPADRSPGAPPPPPPPPVWTPGSAGSSPQAPRKPYRPVHFEDTTPPPRRKENAEQNGCTSGSESESRLRTSQSAPVTGLNTLGSAVTSRLPRAQNPTVTLLQKAREGQIPRGSSYLQQEKDTARLPRDRPSPPKGDPVHALRREYASETEGERSDQERASRKMADAPKKIEGIGPITKEGMPVSLRSEVKDPSKWYKKMYDTIHKNKYDDDYVTIRYKSRRGQAPERVPSNRSQYAYFDPRSGYLSEPEGGLGRLGSSTWSDAYDSDVTTGPRRRTASVQEERRINEPYTPSNKYSTLASARASQEMYNKPGRIENYVPGRSSVVDKEAKQWWDEVMDIFDGQNVSSTTSLPQASPKEKKDLTSTILSKSNMARALKESGYESDSTLVFRRREETDGPLSPAERRAAYRDLQAGGEPPLRGFRSPAPPRQESPRRYVESDVNIHYRCPVRQDPLPLVPERELARQQAEHMKRLYREQRRNKYLQELQDMQNRRHQDNFTPSQKNILPLNRYDEAEKVVAKALYTFNGQTNRELSFRKGEIIHVRRQVDSNWYEGELHGRVGLFPYNYVEIQKGDNPQPQKKPVALEGRARAKFDFTAQTNLELPLKKGEVVILTRRIDQNWWEGRNGNKMGIFPDSYVTILQEPSHNKPDPQLITNHITSHDKPVASPAAHGLMNGTAKRSIGPHSYTPQHNSQALSNAPPATQPLPGYTAKTAQPLLTPSERGYGPPTGQGVDLNNTEPLYVDTNAEAIPYRAMYKYRPQNPDELELNEGDTVYVLEKCDDGWYVGSSQRTGRFGTFPGNYVERI